MLPSVSWSANPITTAPTAEVVRNFSCMTTVATIRKIAMMKASWTMFGKWSGVRSSRHGLITSTTASVMLPRASRSRLTWATTARLAARSGEEEPIATTAARPSARTKDTSDSLSLLRMKRLLVNARAATARTTEAAPRIRSYE